MTTATPLLKLADLDIGYRHVPRNAPTVGGVSFDIHQGESVALVGESGSGKSTIAAAVLGLIAQRDGWLSGGLTFRGTDLVNARPRAYRALFRNDIAYVPQDPRSSLNPVRSIRSQIYEVLRASQLPAHSDRRQYADVAARLLRDVGLDDTASVLNAYPHELSGGMLQRVLIGMAVVKRPLLLIADEPTSALDVTIQRSILELLDGLRTELSLAVLLITHDLSIVRSRTDRTVVLRKGRVEEQGASARVLDEPESAYVRLLTSDVPALNPSRYSDVKTPVGGSTESAIEARGITKRYGAKTVLSDVDLTVRRGTTHALVGESGSGKTTLARIIVRLVREDEGELGVLGSPVADASPSSLRSLREHLQLVYQNPFTSLDPRFTVRALLREPLRNYARSTFGYFSSEVELLEHVGLDESYLDRFPSQLSGGQRQRVAIARALVLEPQILVLDEPTSALDVTVQAQVIDLLVRLQAELGLTYLFISHDISLVRQFADTVTVLYRGVVQESGPTVDVLENPTSPYTRALIESVLAV